MDILEVDPKPLYKKGVRKIYYLKFSEPLYIKDISGAWDIARKVNNTIVKLLGISNTRLMFMDNENIGSKFMLYRFRIYLDNRHIASIRLVSREKLLSLVVVTTSIKEQ